ncbi:cellulose binding domain-containing protein [Sphaerisporangium perillae]|uniref:cellulose binding domain-containing protein n=1 Tax=Sphaerisporangium perillae TaxID=2935860 RepID=UPI00200D866C|nr:cellulose binding domain-containing protein [Sphaerisporangium perillae]
MAYKISSQWQGGFNADVTINVTGAAVSGWTLTFSFAGDQRVSNAWNAKVTQNGKQVTVTDGGWNGGIPAGGSASFGFTASVSGTNGPPAAFTLNGAQCSAA